MMFEEDQTTPEGSSGGNKGVKKLSWVSVHRGIGGPVHSSDHVLTNTYVLSAN